ncbi:hypothetical protein FGSG_13374 [Fusarium graminearum PH-1]|uniref:Chromosome 2, complete genome n=1 Tax=Gibberella zeae (strain ATCC MYA-4620 / CBS 123657 / FGSC 9075 / NRRL 31084 / PH-1) TaxID=229533 RepID=I1S944_GIBZE|nr:hypothetical protein FGSG_13374 [Fusarium graminearum PH-1]ESU14958.1 hypothetical protein FGSG_13374 [Fusarium graminearum PH-1]CEF76725.1 unnamed protein product [Fusarium graminearum]|eukprot:XP_011320383.1 hypothetical protein FGSG_13374 [Fusarium graminearum PH-1]
MNGGLSQPPVQLTGALQNVSVQSQLVLLCTVDNVDRAILLSDPVSV